VARETPILGPDSVRLHPIKFVDAADSSEIVCVDPPKGFAMTDPQRGAYTPQQDAPLQFDARSPASRRPLPMALIASGTLLVMLVAAVAMYYSRGVRGENEPPRPVGESIATLKTAPQPGAQPTDGADGEAYAPQNVAAAKVPTFAPAPEAVQPRPTPAPPQKLTVQTVSPIAIPSSKPQPAPAEAPAAKAAPAPTVVAVKPSPAVQPAAKAPTVALKAQAPKPAVASTPKPVPVKAGAPAPVGGVRVQIGAFSSAALADQGYADVATLMGLSIQGKSKHVEPVDKDGHTLYRATVNGFSDRASAAAFCEALKAKGKICFVKS
jgi:outer membrane biosynthesis protein TonB